MKIYVQQTRNYFLQLPRTSNAAARNLAKIKTRSLMSFMYFFCFSSLSSFAQNSLPAKHLPIIDVHVHAMKVNPAFANDMCPWFLSSMPGGDPSQPAPTFI